jgi:hypothetical protein
MIQKFLKIKRLEKCVKNGFGVFLELECFWSNIDKYLFLNSAPTVVLQK